MSRWRTPSRRKRRRPPPAREARPGGVALAGKTFVVGNLPSAAAARTVTLRKKNIRKNTQGKIMDDASEPRITLHPHSRRVRVVIDGTVLADTSSAIELRESGYPPRQYLPRDDVHMDLLTPSNTLTHCPFKGDAVYFSFGEHKDVAWSYERPMEGLEAIEGRVVFYGEK